MKFFVSDCTFALRLKKHPVLALSHITLPLLSSKKIFQIIKFTFYCHWHLICIFGQISHSLLFVATLNFFFTLFILYYGQNLWLMHQQLYSSSKIASIAPCICIRIKLQVSFFRYRKTSMQIFLYFSYNCTCFYTIKQHFRLE